MQRQDRHDAIPIDLDAMSLQVGGAHAAQSQFQSHSLEYLSAPSLGTVGDTERLEDIVHVSLAPAPVYLRTSLPNNRVADVDGGEPAANLLGRTLSSKVRQVAARTRP